MSEEPAPNHPPSAIGQPGYLAYMLRLRQVMRDGRPVWLASLESAHSGERHAFASLEHLFAFLVHEMESQWRAATELPRECPRGDGTTDQTIRPRTERKATQERR